VIAALPFEAKACGGCILGPRLERSFPESGGELPANSAVRIEAYPVADLSWAAYVDGVSAPSTVAGTVGSGWLFCNSWGALTLDEVPSVGQTVTLVPTCAECEATELTFTVTAPDTVAPPVLTDAEAEITATAGVGCVGELQGLQVSAALAFADGEGGGAQEWWHARLELGDGLAIEQLVPHDEGSHTLTFEDAIAVPIADGSSFCLTLTPLDLSGNASAPFETCGVCEADAIGGASCTSVAKSPHGSPEAAETPAKGCSVSGLTGPGALGGSVLGVLWLTVAARRRRQR
jgi:hypothetical protein